MRQWINLVSVNLITTVKENGNKPLVDDNLIAQCMENIDHLYQLQEYIQDYQYAPYQNRSKLKIK